MASSSTSARKADKADGQRPRPLHVSKSFSRIETASPGSSNRASRANTIHNDAIPERPSLEKEIMAENVKPSSRSSTFDKNAQGERKQSIGDEMVAELGELPIELKSLTDR